MTKKFKHSDFDIYLKLEICNLTLKNEPLRFIFLF